MLLGASAEGYAACCDAIERMDLRPLLGRIEAPTLVISGADDEAAPPEHQQRIADAVPSARHEVVAPAAHVATVERSGEVNALILQHVLEGACAPWPRSSTHARRLLPTGSSPRGAIRGSN